jgi:hypothetical protein
MRDNSMSAYAVRAEVLWRISETTLEPQLCPSLDARSQAALDTGQCADHWRRPHVGHHPKSVAELQATSVISAGIVTTASESDAARVLLKFLTSPAAAAVIKASGMEPGGS